MDLLRWWLLATALVVMAALVWNFAPILVAVLLVGGGLGAVVVAIVALARYVARRRRP